MSFQDLIEANSSYAIDFPHGGFDGVAHAGVMIITCMDSRIDPLRMVGLQHGDAKIQRTPGGRVSTSTLTGCVLGVQLLHVDRIMVVPHTKCAMSKGTDDDIRALIAERSGSDSSWITFGASPDQLSRLRTDVDMVTNHPLIKGRAEVGGFLYDVDTGLLEQLI